MIADMGACLNMTRTPDCHFFAESRHNGTKAVVFSPGLQPGLQVRRPMGPPARRQRRRPSGWPSTHVILKEFHHDKKTPYFLEYGEAATRIVRTS